MLSREALAELGRQYVVVRKSPEALFRAELRSLLDLHGQDWTGPFDRSYQYEFFVEQGEDEVSLNVEISAVAPIAFIGFCYSKGNDLATIKHREMGLNPEQDQLRARVAHFLQQHGYSLVSREFLAQVVAGKTMREWLIHDPED